MNLSEILETNVFRGIYSKYSLDAAFIEIPRDFLKEKRDLHNFKIASYYSRFTAIHVIQYPEGNYFWDYGKIENIYDKNFGHTANTDEGSSGAPVLDVYGEVLGMHTGYSEEKVVSRINNKDIVSENSAIKMTSILEVIKEDFQADRKNKNPQCYFRLQPPDLQSVMHPPISASSDHNE